MRSSCDRIGVQEGRTRCGKCCSATIRGGPAQGAVEPRVENVGGRRGEGNGRSPAALRTAHRELEVARSEQTSILAEAEKRLWRGKSEGEVAERGRRSGMTSSEEPRCNQARQSCRKLRGCASHVSVAHVREQKKFNP
jgi:hypothetical protein